MALPITLISCAFQPLLDAEMMRKKEYMESNEDMPDVIRKFVWAFRHRHVYWTRPLFPQLGGGGTMRSSHVVLPIRDSHTDCCRLVFRVSVTSDA